MTEPTRRVEINGVATDVGSSELATLLVELGVGAARPGLAVAVDGVVVPRQEWSATRLSDGQRVEIITARQGG